MSYLSFRMSYVLLMHILSTEARPSDFLEKVDDGTFFTPPTTVVPSLMSASFSVGVRTPPTTSTVSMSQTMIPSESLASDSAPDSPERPPAEPAGMMLPATTKTEQFLLTAADQESGSRDERLNRVIRSKYEAGLLKPYNYVKGYARLSRWMDKKSVIDIQLNDILDF